MLDTLSPQVHFAFGAALSAAYAENAAGVTSKQLLAGIVLRDSAMFDRILPSDQWERLRQRFEEIKSFRDAGDSAPRPQLPMSEEVVGHLMAAKNQADTIGEPIAGTRHILLSMALNPDSPAGEIFKECGVDLPAMVEKIHASELAPEVVRARAAVLKTLKTYESTVTVLAETPLTRDRENYFTPFVSVLGARRPPEAKLWAGWPYLCVEVVTPEEKMMALLKRQHFYLNPPTRYVWILSPLTKTAYAATAETGLREIKDSALCTENPTLEIPLAEIFE